MHEQAMARAPQSRIEARQRAGFWFVLPALIVYVVFFGLPFAATIWLSFTEWNGVGVPDFSGLSNYARLATDSAMWAALGNNMIWVVIGTVVPVVVGLILSVMLWSDARGSMAYRTIFFLPVVLSPVVIGIIWMWIYNPLFGLLNVSLRGIGLGDWAIGWLGEPETALYAVLVTAIWSYVGFCIVVLFAGLQKVDPELVAAARIDGANARQRFLNVIVPQIRPVLTMVIVYTVIGGFNVFDVVWVMTQGGPNNSTEVIATYTYEVAFRANQYGYGATLSMVMSLVALLAAWITMRMRRAEEGR
jgi:multiple sugar transport system permease protein/raffinose/stachyose/melibiose transport system permease protein